MRIRSLIAIASVALISGCATPVERGVAAYNRGSYGQAAAQWNGPAANGDPAAQYNLGLLWENGQSSEGKNLNEAAAWYYRSANQGFIQAMVALARVQLEQGNRVAAVSWLTLAARWNDQTAITSLMQLRESVPTPDLYNQRQQALALQQQQALGQMGYAIGCAVAGGCNQPPPVQRAAPPSGDFNCRAVSSGSNPTYRCRN